MVGDEVLIVNAKGTPANNANVGDFESRYITSISTNTITLNQNVTNGYDTVTQVVFVQRIPNYTNVTIGSGGQITATSWNGNAGGVVMFRANGTVNIGAGSTINANALGYRGGAVQTAGGNGGCINGGANQDGAGYGGETYGGFASNGGYPWSTPAVKGGAGGGSYQIQTSGSFNTNYSQTGSVGGAGGGASWNYGWVGGYGGAGGYATAGAGSTNGSGMMGGSTTTQHGSGGGTYGVTNLSKLLFGSGGGGGDYSGGVCGTGTIGGNGGGIIHIAANTITLTGGIQANGGGSTYGGGGAGGSIKLHALTMNVGTGLVTATGGTSYYSGGVGRIALFSPSSIVGTTVPTYSTASY
jgi:hypothetical protein